jgi:hypothetical protein
MQTRLYSEEMQRLIMSLEEVKRAIESVSRPPDHVILDDVDLRNMLKVSRRTSAYWRGRGEITYSKLGGKIYYRLSDVLELIERNEIAAITPRI